MKNATLFCFILLLILSGCRQDEIDLAGDLPGEWLSKKVVVSGTDISNISTYSMRFWQSDTCRQVLTSSLNGQVSTTSKTGVWQPSGKKIVITFAGESPSEWLVQNLSATDLQVEFSRNGEQFAVDFLKK